MVVQRWPKTAGGRELMAGRCDRSVRSSLSPPCDGWKDVQTRLQLRLRPWRQLLNTDCGRWRSSVSPSNQSDSGRRNIPALNTPLHSQRGTSLITFSGPSSIYPHYISQTPTFSACTPIQYPEHIRY